MAAIKTKVPLNVMQNMRHFTFWINSAPGLLSRRSLSRHSTNFNLGSLDTYESYIISVFIYSIGRSRVSDYRSMALKIIGRWPRKKYIESKNANGRHTEKVRAILFYRYVVDSAFSVSCSRWNCLHGEQIMDHGKRFENSQHVHFSCKRVSGLGLKSYIRVDIVSY